MPLLLAFRLLLNNLYMDDNVLSAAEQQAFYDGFIALGVVTREKQAATLPLATALNEHGISADMIADPPILTKVFKDTTDVVWTSVSDAAGKRSTVYFRSLLNAIYPEEAAAALPSNNKQPNSAQLAPDSVKKRKVAGHGVIAQAMGNVSPGWQMDLYQVIQHEFRKVAKQGLCSEEAAEYGQFFGDNLDKIVQTSDCLFMDQLLSLKSHPAHCRPAILAKYRYERNKQGGNVDESKWDADESMFLELVAESMNSTIRNTKSTAKKSGCQFSPALVRVSTPTTNSRANGKYRQGFGS